MRKETRLAFNGYMAQIALLNGIDSAAEKFAIAPSVQQTMEQTIQKSSEFLSRINVYGVTDLQGEKIGVGVSGTIAGRTDTTVNDRQPRDMTALENKLYQLYKTDFDTAIPYSRLDQWARFPEFQAMLRDAILKQQALDRMMIGFNGKTAAPATNRVTNPLLQDVNIGWLEQYRQNAAARVMKEVVPASGKVKVGATGDYKNLDAVVFDAVNDLIAEEFQENPDLVVICGRQLLSDKYFPILNQNQAPSEQLAADLVISQKRIGNLPAVRVPYFPPNAIMVTPLDNLSIYYQEGGRRRTVTDNAKRDRIENYESSNEGYVVENYGAGCVVENIQLV